MVQGENPPITTDVRTPPPPGHIRLMDDGECRRFVHHMLWLVMDEAEPCVALSVLMGPAVTEICGSTHASFFKT